MKINMDGPEIHYMYTIHTKYIWYKKGLHDLDNHDGVISHLEPSYNVKSSGP